MELLQACEDGKVRKLKGFGEKTEEGIKQSLLFTASNKSKMLFYNAEHISKLIEQDLKILFPEAFISTAGEIRRKLEIIEKITLVIGTDTILEVYGSLSKSELLKHDLKSSGPFTWRGCLSDDSLKVEIHLTSRENFINILFLHTGSGKHLSNRLANQKTLIQILKEETYKNEESVYEKAELPYIVPELREGLYEFNNKFHSSLPDLLKMQDLKGVIHSHSLYSDGKNSLKEMAEKCLTLGYEYLGITDHSKTAFYANGLDEYRIVQQHREIDVLNKELAPFRIFKGIESDILNDGSLDYSDEVLSSFDFVIASVHSNLKMDITKATDRLIKAISNPYTTFLGHATGRLLLRREGYPIDYKAVIDACSSNGVIIEINANPHRLDIDWKWIQHGLEENVLFSINPDAHEIDTIENMYYGVCVARKGGLTNNYNFNCLSMPEADAYFLKRKKKINN